MREILPVARFEFTLDCVDFEAGERIVRPTVVELRVEKWKGRSNRWRTVYCSRRAGRLGWDCSYSTLRAALLAQTWKGPGSRPADVAEAVRVVRAALKAK